MISKETLSKEQLEVLLKQAALGTKTYALIDTAKDETLFVYIKGRKEAYLSLLMKDTANELKAVSPYLIEILPEDARWLVDDILAKKNGFILACEMDGKDLVRHLSDWIYQKDDNGKVNLFRHYDPVVLSELLDRKEETSDSIITEIYPDSVIVMQCSEKQYNKWIIGNNE